jgi:heme exporter protein D
MMPDLGKYAFEVSAAYVISIALLLLLIAVSMRKAAKAKRLLEQQEDRIRKNGK